MKKHLRIFRSTLIKNIFLVSLGLLILLASGTIAFFYHDKTAKAGSITCNGSACPGDDINNGDGMDVVIDNMTAIISGQHRFKSLTITNNGVLTHDQFASNESVANSNKKVDLIIDNDLILEKGGKIDVTGKGYPGGDVVCEKTLWGADVCSLEDGSGKGAGKSTIMYSSSDSGFAYPAGFRGMGGGGNFQGGSTYPQNSSAPSILEVGSGGGSTALFSGSRPLMQTYGGNGGGRINLNIGGTLKISSGTSVIAANGDDGEMASYQTSLRGDSIGLVPGGGSGGSVWVKAKNITYPTGLPEVNVDGGKTLDRNHFGQPGSISLTRRGLPGTVHQFFSISAQGGASIQPKFNDIWKPLNIPYKSNGVDIDWARFGLADGAGGGGGDVHVEVDDRLVIDPCMLNYMAHSIPASCEGKDVVIDGAGYKDPTVSYYTFDNTLIPDPHSSDDYPLFYADDVQVKNGVDCSGDTNDPDCNTYRHFTNLTIRYANLTHQAVTLDNMNLQDTDGDKSLADQPKGSARWKKVDLKIDGNLVFENNGRIDVSGKGYPGGLGKRLGCGGDPYEDWYDIITHGSGPGGGGVFHRCFNSGQLAIGGGGGYGGQGGQGGVRVTEWVPDPKVSGGAAYPNPYNGDLSPVEFEFGSGGGGAGAENDGYGASSAGSAGGGRVKIDAGSISFANDHSFIAANGGTVVYAQDHAATSALGGSGSGGTIWVRVNTIRRAHFYPSAAKSGIYSLDGTIDPPANNIKINLSANGGDTIDWGRYLAVDNYGAGGGAGGRIIVNVAALPTPTPLNGSINGDIYSKGRDSSNRPIATNLHLSTIKNGSIIAGRDVQGQNAIICSQTVVTNCVNKLSNYTIDWNSIASKSSLADVLNRAFEYSPPGLSLPTTFNLNSKYNNPSDNTMKNPEGGIWHIKAGNGTVTIPAAGVTYRRRGTIVVEGTSGCTVKIKGDIKRATVDDNAAFGLISLGCNIVIENTPTATQIIRAGIYTTGSIAIQNRTTAIDFDGFMVAQGTITLPANAANSNFTYNPLLSTVTRRPLPGFDSVQQMIISNIAP